ncbi:unnamed protein product [Pleuronectes platessa]|uniref:Uncharacterized protein n=1 Tax=Pleuronectes platessa TaxID=8262 RepID=A0A9N7U003_PLEPL|nr:unnamed protein product [Pleuronectes platessa]
MVITQGADFSEELMNCSSPSFKSLAFDVQQLVSEAFGLTELRRLYKSCQVGSVAVTLDLWFYHIIDAKEAEQQLGAGLTEAGNRGLVIDRSSIHITEKREFTTETPTTETQTSITPTTAMCPPHQRHCADRWTCVLINHFCDGVSDCPDASDEDSTRCAELSGSAPPRTVWLLTDQSTVEFIADDVTNLSGFNATYSATNLSSLSDQQKLTCTFEQGMCFWRQRQDDDDGDWIRTNGSTFPPLTGPSLDHTLGDGSGGFDVDDVIT